MITSDIEDMIRKYSGISDPSRVAAASRSGRFILVRRNPEIYIYLGEDGDYIIVDGVYCSCNGFMSRIGRARDSVGCTHVLAARRGVERIHDFSWIGDGVLVRIIWEVLTGGLTHSLREIIYRVKR